MTTTDTPAPAWFDINQIVDPHLRDRIHEMTVQVREATATIEPVITRAGVALGALSRAIHAAQADLYRALPDEVAFHLVDGIHAAVYELTGAHALWDALGELSNLTHPEKLVRDEEVEG